MDDDPRPKNPGQTEDDPYCLDCFCPAALSCRRFSAEPFQGPPATISIGGGNGNPLRTLLGGLICEWFQPETWNPNQGLSRNA